LLSDGHAKIFSYLQDTKLYDDVTLNKEECINNVQKSIGTALQNFTSDEHKHDIILEGKSYGSLQKEMIK
jgi:hypothetical protein